MWERRYTESSPGRLGLLEVDAYNTVIQRDGHPDCQQHHDSLGGYRAQRRHELLSGIYGCRPTPIRI